MDSIPTQCIHHWMCSEGYILQHDPEFFDKHPKPQLGYQYELCIKCDKVRYWALYAQRPFEEKIRGGYVPTYMTTKIEGYLTIQEACTVALVKENTMRGYLRSGKILGKMELVGRKSYWYVLSSSLAKYMEESRDPRHLNRVRGLVS